MDLMDRDELSMTSTLNQRCMIDTYVLFIAALYNGDKW